ncbi:hypothetical protein IQ238_14590 [Pleurocapsales cyanobacterium LEGE 06147]|nr:hypothetical protein [Pleurocapsales cyanobacterium LEGE 06147]
MALICTQINEWIEEEVSKPVEEWEERQEERCRKRPWYDPRGWFCWLVTILVKVIRWVVVTVGKWVTRTVCKLVATVIELISDVLGGLWDIIAGIFTLNWRRILDGLIKIGIGIVLGIIRIGRILLLGDTIDFIISEINKGRLRRYVRELLENKYSGEVLEQIKEAIRLERGAFGLRLNATTYRTVLDSETPSPGTPSVPNLVVLHENGDINLRALCGFEFDEGFWNRKRYKTLKKGTVIGGGGGGEFDNPISENNLETYLSSRGTQGPPFIILPMRDGVLDTKIRAAEEKGRELALMLKFEETTIPVTRADHIVHNGFDTGRATDSLEEFLTTVISRTSKTVNDSRATAELCNPVAIGVFRYTDTLRGIAANLRTSKCQLPGKNVSGVTFIDNIPDHIWKYVPIHELGHYFGLCHVDGLDRIMYSSKQNSWWSISLIPNIYLKGEPFFTLDEAKATWDYIVENFNAQCLGAQPVPIP